MAGRNEKCPCGSGRKYKKCCLNGTPPYNIQAIGGLADMVGLVEHEGEVYPYIKPKTTYLDCMDFDRPICEMGLKEYVRPRMATEEPLEDTDEAKAIRQEMEGTTHFLVKEVKPGTRIKMGLTVNEGVKIPNPYFDASKN